MPMNEELAVDPDGIPILTDLVDEHETAAPVAQHAETTAASPAVITDELLQSKSFQQQLEQLTASMSQQLIEQIEQTLRPAIEQAVSLALEDSSSLSATAIRQQLEQALPDLLAQAHNK